MNRAMQIAVAIAAGLGTFYALHWYRQRPPSADVIGQKLEEMRATAERKHPNMPKTDALKAVAAEEATRRLATQNANQQASTAAGMFWGFYYMNTVARVEYCSSRGVDLGPFVTAFNAEHGDEKQMAQTISTRTGLDPNQMLNMLRPQFNGIVEQDMRDVAAGAKVPLEQTCQLFNENAEQAARLIQLPANVKQILVKQG